MASVAFQAVNLLSGLVGGIFGAHHAAAVKNEAEAMNTVIPEVNQSFQNIIAGLNSGQFTVQEANDYLGQVLKGYDDVVYSQYKVKRKSGNGPDLVGQQFATDVANIKQLINSGKAGTIVISDIPAAMASRFMKAGYMNYPPFQLTYNGPYTALSSVENLLGLGSVTGSSTGGNITVGSLSIPLWVPVILGAGFLLVSYGKR